MALGRLGGYLISMLESHGWAVVERVVDRGRVDALIALARELAGIDLDDRATWDVAPAAIAAWAHQAQWDVRQDPRVHRVFAELWGQDELLVSQDALGYKPPVAVVPDAREGAGGLADANGMSLHWDLHPGAGRHVYQGVLYLTDVGPDDGAFCAVPGVFGDLRGWLDRHPDADTSGDEQLDLEGHAVVAVPGGAGDLVIFDSRLPHGNLANHGDRPRLVQYVSMTPPGFWGERREEHAQLYLSGRANPSYRWKAGFDGPAPCPPARLTELGRKLVGIDPW